MKDRIRKLFTNVWNIPNVLTMLRLVLIPVFVAVFFSTPEGQDRIAALVVFAAASITDMFDGMLARRLNQITDFGKLFDPLADKVMVVTALVCQAVAGVFPWAAIIIVAAKELVMFLGGLFMLSKGVVVYSNYVGKAAQVCFIAALILAFFHEKLPLWGGQTPDRIFLWITVALSLTALVIYAAAAVKKIRNPDPDQETAPREVMRYIVSNLIQAIIPFNHFQNTGRRVFQKPGFIFIQVFFFNDTYNVIIQIVILQSNLRNTA